MFRETVVCKINTFPLPALQPFGFFDDFFCTIVLNYRLALRLAYLRLEMCPFSLSDASFSHHRYRESLKSIAAILKKVGAREAHQKVAALVE